VPADYFNTVLYTGDGTSPRSITGVGFQPDFVWMKSRSATLQNGLHDIVRGVGKGLYSNLTNAETTNEVSGYLSSFDSDGFTTTAGSSNNYTFNYPSQTYVGWNWLAGGSGVTNTDGTITSTVSANQKAGFSIVSYTDGGSDADTIGHGLSQKPDLYFCKTRSTTSDWFVFTDVVDGSWDYLRLNTTGTQISASQSANATTFNPVGIAGSSIAYCFHSVEGYSKFGSYVGNGSTDGPFVYTGFRPAFIMLKASTRDASWIVIDAERDQENVASKRLLPNYNSAESSGTHYIDFLSNGFKMRGANNNSNGSGETYIYMAFAEMPFKYSNAR